MDIASTSMAFGSLGVVWFPIGLDRSDDILPLLKYARARSSPAKSCLAAVMASSNVASVFLCANLTPSMGQSPLVNNST